ncbi:hypothetical protein U1707_10215 [Sphingomonas sp. PB2P12]
MDHRPTASEAVRNLQAHARAVESLKPTAEQVVANIRTFFQR